MLPSAGGVNYGAVTTAKYITFLRSDPDKTMVELVSPQHKLRFTGPIGELQIKCTIIGLGWYLGLEPA
jgi:hypothetical protein